MNDDPCQPGDILLTTITGNTGRLIRIGQWLNGSGFTDYEHAAVYIARGKIVEAEPGGARLADLAEYQGRPRFWSTGRLTLTQAQRNRIADAAVGYIGVRYSFLDYFALAAHRLRIPIPGLRRYIASTGHMICSQLADQCYADAGVHLFGDDRWPGYVTPGDLYRRLR